jgi:hypothetical protein
MLVFANAAGNERSRRIKEKTGARQLRAEPAKFVNPLYTEREIWEITKDEMERLPGTVFLSLNRRALTVPDVRILAVPSWAT